MKFPEWIEKKNNSRSLWIEFCHKLGFTNFQVFKLSVARFFRFDWLWIVKEIFVLRLIKWDYEKSVNFAFYRILNDYEKFCKWNIKPKALFCSLFCAGHLISCSWESWIEKKTKERMFVLCIKLNNKNLSFEMKFCPSSYSSLLRLTTKKKRKKMKERGAS